MTIDPSHAGSLPKILSAVFYGICSILIVFVNKILLTNFRFPSFLWVGIGQMVATIFILSVAQKLGVVSFPRLDRTIPRKVCFKNINETSITDNGLF